MAHKHTFNPWRACSARFRFTVVAVFVCLLSHISPLGLLFVVKTLPHTHQAMKVKKVKLKLLHCGECSLCWTAIRMVGHFCADNTDAHCTYASLLCDAPC